MKKRWLWICILVVVAALVCGGLYYCRPRPLAEALAWPDAIDGDTWAEIDVVDTTLYLNYHYVLTDADAKQGFLESLTSRTLKRVIFDGSYETDGDELWLITLRSKDGLNTNICIMRGRLWAGDWAYSIDTNGLFDQLRSIASPYRVNEFATGG